MGFLDFGVWGLGVATVVKARSLQVVVVLFKTFKASTGMYYMIKFFHVSRSSHGSRQFQSYQFDTCSFHVLSIIPI